VVDVSRPLLHLILLAGGRGLRAAAGDATPKQFRPTGRGLLFTVGLQTFLGSEDWCPDTATVVVPDAWQPVADEALKGLGIPRFFASAGASRTASTWNAAEVLRVAHEPAADHLVAVHDAARPFASAALLNRLCAAAHKHGGAVPGVAVPDTIVRSDGPGAVYLQRDLLRAVQTPQVFRWDIFQAAHAHAAEQGLTFTDDGGLLASRGHDPAVVEGEPGNWKVTTDADWERARALLSD
jgi:2-C-methyl-D-erythritol 4-phosphate cytidylyltransferase/2-C-methyl-D-erythritol 2,4-cyclodiphosphate synthase